KRARGRLGLPLGLAPFGYRNKDGGAVIVPGEANALKEIVFDAFLTGRKDYKTLARDMAGAGWFTRSRNKMAEQRARGEEPLGGTWKADTVRFILQNSFYAGWIVDSVSGTRVRGQHEPILTDEEFDAIQAIIAERRESRTPFASQVQRRPDKYR